MPLTRLLPISSLLGAIWVSSCAADAAKPNILVILADDMGYSDIGCYGGEMATPAIDRLAHEGMYLTNVYNGSMCVVSRACLLTGHYWPKMMTQFSKTPILPEKLKEAGYRTGLIGKWHMRGEPLERGFDHFFGFLGGAGDHFTGPKEFKLDRKPFTDIGPDFYSADAYAERAARFITSPPAGQEQQPFFLYLAFQTPHNPLQAPKADILRNRGKYLTGWQALREARFKRQKELGLFPADAVLPDYPKNLPDWNTLSPEQKDLEDLRRAVYAGMVERMDQGVGRVMKALQDAGKLTNTLVLFMSDNGSDPFSSGDAGNLKKDKLPGDPGSNYQIGNGWAYANVTPLRQYKISEHQGGTRTGAIAWWPGVTGKPGRIDHSQIHFVDMLPTLVEAAGLSPASLQVSGESFLPVLKGAPWKRKNPLFFQFVDNRAIRTPEWTLAEIDGKGWELYQTASDPFENVNVAAKHPEVVSDLNARWLAWWKTESGKPDYTPSSTKTEGGGGYCMQGDRGTGVPYKPSAMPAKLKDRLPVPAR